MIIFVALVFAAAWFAVSRRVPLLNVTSTPSTRRDAGTVKVHHGIRNMKHACCHACAKDPTCRGTTLRPAAHECLQAPAPLKRFGSVGELRKWAHAGGAAAWRRAERLKHARWQLEVDEYRVAHGLVGDVE